MLCHKACKRKDVLNEKTSRKDVELAVCISVPQMKGTVFRLSWVSCNKSGRSCTLVV